MSNAIEIEAKVLLSKDDYQKLVKHFPHAPRYVQTNHYIDSDDRVLLKDGIALRIREKKGLYELTLKTPLSQGLLEKNVAITIDDLVDLRDEDKFPQGDIARFLTMLDIDISQLKILTSMTTERIDIQYEGGLLSLDRSTYSGQTDYEVEFEFNNMNDAERILKNLLDELEIPCQFSRVSKIHRAMAAIGK